MLTLKRDMKLERCISNLAMELCTTLQEVLNSVFRKCSTKEGISDNVRNEWSEF